MRTSNHLTSLEKTLRISQPRKSLSQTKFALVAIAVLVINATPCFANSHCNPLLVMIEGGARSSDGPSMEKLVDDIQDDFASRGIAIADLDNGPFSSIKTAIFPYLKKAKVQEAAKQIKSSNHWPVVIVGHSLGAATAWDLANSMPIQLLVTLDGVSFRQDRRPAMAVSWRNVWVNKNAPGPDWKSEPADIDYTIGNYSHSDVEKMWSWRHPKFGSVEDAVLKALLKCPRSIRVSPPKPGELCKLDSVGCKVKWEIGTKHCRRRIVAKFFEYDIEGNLVANSPKRTIPLGAAILHEHPCKSPANKVCYGARSPSERGSYWGVGLDGTKKCDGCCLSCRIWQKVEDIYVWDHSKSYLTCP